MEISASLPVLYAMVGTWGKENDPVEAALAFYSGYEHHEMFTTLTVDNLKFCNVVFVTAKLKGLNICLPLRFQAALPVVS